MKTKTVTYDIHVEQVETNRQSRAGKMYLATILGPNLNRDFINMPVLNLPVMAYGKSATEAIGRAMYKGAERLLYFVEEKSARVRHRKGIY